MVFKRIAPVVAVALIAALGMARTAEAALADTALVLKVNNDGHAWLKVAVASMPPISGYDIVSTTNSLIPTQLVRLQTTYPTYGYGPIILTTGNIAEASLSVPLTPAWTNVMNGTGLINLGFILPTLTDPIKSGLAFSWTENDGTFHPLDFVGPLNIEFEGGGGPEIPEPASIAIWCLIGASFVGLRIWRRR